MSDIINLTGKIIFEPINLTKKHRQQSSWKKTAFVEFDGDVCEYYGWFINKRYNLELLKSARKAHISFINDSIKDLTQDGKITNEAADIKWEKVKKKWDGTQITITLSVDVRSDGHHWWLNIPQEERNVLQGIREELGLGKPYWGMHMSIGYPHPRHEEHSQYIFDCIKNGYIQT